jgi:predicted metalloprotease
MRIDELPRSDNVEDRRGQGSGPGGFRIPGGRGGLGIGTIVLLGLIGWWLGIDPGLLIGGADILLGGGKSQQETREAPGTSETRAGAPTDQTGQLVSAVLGSTEVQWQKIFEQYGRTYEPPALVKFFGVTRSACGYAPERSQGLSRHLLLSRSRTALPRLRRGQQGLPVLASLRDHP